ncbi:arylesterase [Sorangium cellulosum]|uniref:Arylesterase n=1 Tax=Sorangium cellulosum TaxID=56 RepID=A0A2L0F4H5_SORCE|nr:alpha/beta hydrolase [Sorangium cellulosum]AUX46470.1 arylesterase [Sorangium cellulosum]
MDEQNIDRPAATVEANAGPAAASGQLSAQETRRKPRPAPGPLIATQDGARLFHRDWGAGKPVLFLSGWALSSEMWGYVMVDLVDHGLRCVAYDRRGHGRSSDPGRGYDYDTLADDLAAVLEQLDLREVTLVGHSMSGGEIARYLSRHGGGRIARAVFLAPTTPMLLRAADNPDGLDLSLVEQARAAMRADYPGWLADNAPPFFVDGTPPAMRAWVQQMMLQCSMKALLDCNRASVEADFRDDLRRITVPTLVLHGDRDVSAPLALTGEKTAALVPGSRLVVYEGAPHGLFITHRERLSRDLLAFARG